MAPTRSLQGPIGAEQDRMVGRVLGSRYRVLSRLGEGGMGAVYLCEHAVLGRRYAVKVLRPDLGTDAELVERFRNEAIAASRVGGDHVVDVLDFGTADDGALYYVMEALEGRSLGAVIAEDGPLEVPRALALLEQLCRALGAAHARGVVHRDVKPDNVFVVPRGDGAERAKIIDFGISKVTREGSTGERLTRAGTIIGTPEYMAPEQAAGDPVDHRADVYALGVLAYEMLTGTLPIVATTPIATLVAHQTRAPEPPSLRRAGIPPEVDALVLAALAKRPEDRPGSMDALAAEIAAIRAGRVPAAPRPPPPRSSSRPGVATVALPPARRTLLGRGGLRALAIAGAAALLGAGAALWARAPSRPAAAVATAAQPPSPQPPSPQPSPPALRGEREGTQQAAPADRPNPISLRGEREGTRPPPAAVKPARRAPPAPHDPHLDDPYRGGGLKPDPFE